MLMLGGALRISTLVALTLPSTMTILSILCEVCAPPLFLHNTSAASTSHRTCAHDTVLRDRSLSLQRSGLLPPVLEKTWFIQFVRLILDVCVIIMN